MRISWLEFGATAAIAIALGLAGGNLTAAGMQPRTAAIQPAYPRAAAPDPADLEPATYEDPATTPDCIDCSDYQAGYRWADYAQVTQGVDCIADSWTFQRGCLAFVRDRNRSAI